MDLQTRSVWHVIHPTCISLLEFVLLVVLILWLWEQEQLDTTLIVKQWAALLFLYVPNAIHIVKHVLVLVMGNVNHVNYHISCKEETLVLMIVQLIITQILHLYQQVVNHATQYAQTALAHQVMNVLFVQTLLKYNKVVNVLHNATMVFMKIQIKYASLVILPVQPVHPQ